MAHRLDQWSQNEQVFVQFRVSEVNPVASSSALELVRTAAQPLQRLGSKLSKTAKHLSRMSTKGGYSELVSLELNDSNQLMLLKNSLPPH